MFKKTSALPIANPKAEFCTNVSTNAPIAFAQMSAVVKDLITEDGIKRRGDTPDVKAFATLLGLSSPMLADDRKYMCTISRYLWKLITTLQTSVAMYAARADDIARRFKVSPEDVRDSLGCIRKCLYFSPYFKKESASDDTSVGIQTEDNGFQRWEFMEKLDVNDLGMSGGYSKVRVIEGAGIQQQMIFKKIIHFTRQVWLESVGEVDPKIENPIEEVLAQLLMQKSKPELTAGLHPTQPMIFYVSKRPGERAICRTGMVMDQMVMAADDYLHEKRDLEGFVGRLVWVYRRGIQTLDELPVGHGDYKLENLMLDTSDKLKVIDYGNTRVLGSSQVTRHATSPFYTSLEGAQSTRQNEFLEDKWGFLMSCLHKLSQYHFKNKTELGLRMKTLNDKIKAMEREPNILKLNELVLELKGLKMDHVASVPQELWEGVSECLLAYSGRSLSAWTC